METSGDTLELGNTVSNSKCVVNKRANQYKYWCLTWNGYKEEPMETVLLCLEILKRMSK